MAPLSPTTRNITDNDELDDILNGIVEGRDIPDESTTHTPTAFRSNADSSVSGALGVDEEIIVTKKRAPAPKLDDHRLLSDPGIPRLRKISKERLRFKGRGHEYGDIARMLNMYQLWLDDLYPRAKFADALSIIEKVGHTKRMQMMRKDWIDEGKPRRSRDEEDDGDTEEQAASEARAVEDDETAMRGVEGGTTTDAGRRSAGVEESRDASGPPHESNADGDPDEDELDALLAEDMLSNNMGQRTLPVRTAVEDDPFADDMDAMAEMEDMW
ncbi:chromosome segregation in meiosis-related protein [Coniothyrium glycines]